MLTILLLLFLGIIIAPTAVFVLNGVVFFFPKLYKTVSNDTWVFVRLEERVRLNMWHWQRVKKLFWFVYIKNGRDFWDWPTMFYDKEE